MTLALYLAGSDKTSLMQAGTLAIADNLNGRSTCSFELVDPVGAYRPTVGSEVVIRDGDQLVASDVAMTFTRSSPAWLDGVEYATNVPRFPSQSGTVGVMVEQGATNLLNANNASFETDVGGVALTGITLAAGATKAHSSTNPYTGTYCAAISVTAQNQGARVDATGSFATGDSYVVSGYLNVPAGQTLQVYAVDITNGVVSAATSVTGTGAYQRVEATVTVGASTSTTISLQARANAAAPNFTFRMDALQVETGTKATSWQLPGTARGPETLTVPTAGLLTPSAGSVIIRAYVGTDTSARVLLSTRDASGNNGLQLYSSGGLLRALFRNATTQTEVSGATPATGWHTIGVAQGVNLNLWADGALKAGGANVAAPSTQGANAYMGSNHSGEFQWNNPFAFVYYYNRELTPAEMAAATAGNPPPDFTAYLDFTGGSLSVLERKKLFAGSVDSFGEEMLDGSGALAYEVDCVDYNAITDRHLVARAYESQTLGAITSDIVTQDLAGEGLTTTYVQTGPTIDKAVFNYNTATEAFNNLAELAGYIWWIDYSKKLHMCTRDTNAAPFALTATSANFRRLKVTRTREQYRNRQYVRAGYDLTDPRTESFKGDGTNKTFVLSFPVGKVPSSITVGGVSKTLGIRGVDTGKDFYWSKGDASVTQDDAAAAVGAGVTAAVTYQGMFPILLASTDDAAIAGMKSTEGGTGVYESIKDEPNIDTEAMATADADALLRKFGRIPKIVEFETDEPGLAAGQLISITLPAHGLSGSFLIESVRARDVSGQFLRYSVKCLDGEALGGWEDFFRAIANQGRKFVIRENEVVVLLRKMTETITASDVVSFVSAAPESRADFALADFSEAS